MSTHNILSSDFDRLQWDKAPSPLRHLGPELERTLEGLYAVVRILRVNDVELTAARDSDNAEGECLDSFLTSGLHAAAQALAWNARLTISKIHESVSKEDESGVEK